MTAVSVFTAFPAGRAATKISPVSPSTRAIRTRAADMTKLYYFGLSGRGEPVRILLRLAGAEFEDYVMSGEVRPLPDRYRHPVVLASCSSVIHS